MKRFILKTIVILGYFLFLGCEGNDPAPVENSGYVNIYLSSKPWSQDSLSGVFVYINELSIKNISGTEWKATLDTRHYNLLDYAEEPFKLGTATLPSNPYSSYTFAIETFLIGQDPNPDKAYKVTLCHYPGGNPGNFQTIDIHSCSVRDHLKHGDTPGACESGGKPSNDAYSYIQFKDESIAPMFRKQREYIGNITAEVLAGDTVDLLIMLDLANSIQVEKIPEGEDCDFIHLFNPAIEARIVPRTATMFGNYQGNRLTGRRYFVYAYTSGTFKDSEALTRPPFSTAVAGDELDNQGRFEIPNLKKGTYDLIVAELFGNRYRVIKKAVNVLHDPNAQKNQVITP